MITPFINFAGRASEAIAFYEVVFEIKDKQIMYYKDAPSESNTSLPKEMEDYVLHSEMVINGTKIWIGDSPAGITPGDMVSLAVNFSSEEELGKTFEKLKIDGTVIMEPTPQFYSPLFGMIEDKFGVIWHLIC